MHTNDILKFIKQHKGFATIETLHRYFPNASTDVITMAVYKYLKEKRA